MVQLDAASSLFPNNNLILHLLPRQAQEERAALYYKSKHYIFHINFRFVFNIFEASNSIGNFEKQELCVDGLLL
jgi:hypothetical protein